MSNSHINNLLFSDESDPSKKYKNSFVLGDAIGKN